MSGASERGKGRASNPVLTSGLLAVLNHSEPSPRTSGWETRGEERGVERRKEDGKIDGRISEGGAKKGKGKRGGEEVV